MLTIKTVSVIGADGNMGAKVSGLIAAYTGAKVFMVCLFDKDKAVEAAVNSVKMDLIRERLIAKTFDDLEECVGASDWVFESVSENMEIKSKVLQRISKSAKPGVIVTSGTSGLSIGELSENFSENLKARYFGTHFFNPPYMMTLCEVIRSPKTDSALFDEMSAYLKEVMARDVVETTDTPAFLGNRIGFHFLNKALLYAVQLKDKGGIDYIDSILGPFTGRDMVPINTIDFVGLDVHKAIVENIQKNTNDYDNGAFVLPGFVNRLIAEGKLGRKTKEGFYKTIINEDKSKTILVYDIATGVYREKRKYEIPFAKAMVDELSNGNLENAIRILKEDRTEEGRLCRFFLAAYIAYSFTTAQAVSPKITDADTAMTTGFSWIGPVALMQALGGYEEVLRIAKEDDREGNLVKQLSLIREQDKKPAEPSYGYRKFFRAKM